MSRKLFLQAGAAALGSGVTCSPGVWGQPEEAKITPKNELPFEAGELAAPSPTAGQVLRPLCSSCGPEEPPGQLEQPQTAAPRP